MSKSLRTVLSIGFALVITVASAAPIGGYGLEKKVSTTASFGVAK